MGHDGANFPQLKPEEIKGIVTELKEPGHLGPTGLFVASQKYTVIQGLPGAVIRGKNGYRGITIKKTGQAMVVGVYDEPVNPRQCDTLVFRLADSLIAQGL